MLYTYTEEELRSFCRQSIESLEMWARRLIHEKLIEKYGASYVNHKTSEENYLIKREVRDHIQSMLQNNRGRFHRDVDTLFFEHIIYFLCNQIQIWHIIYKNANLEGLPWRFVLQRHRMYPA